ncbi:TAXI family TRAP transporter solute-binding subunit [Bradyrhizobium sp.]|uniref:TAXI family TRAP transporter solute-binding subunit n=1 Tax=Bradyrhizobium sp. TaxID=376 RepID=UPI001DB629A6|nr:TAXI family TRAP transporter solute-binding subunit [Bradyrhizobium sp.]MBI5321409.1 C4-dicarboxylate ABC transporter substrate-binding protein [Bradyrhizobium sp.]
MSVEAPIPPAGKQRKRIRIIKSNRVQIFLFVLLTLVLTVTTVWGARIWLKNSETLVFAVGDPNGPEARFANKLATMLKNNLSRLRVKIVTNADNAKALAQFDRREANLAVLRTDAKVPARARAVAILDHDLVLVLSPGGKKIKSLAELKKKKVAVISDNESGSSFIRSVLELADSPATAPLMQVVPPGSPVDKLFASGFAAVIAIAPASKLIKDKSYEQYARRGGLTVNAIEAAKLLTRKYPALSDETIAAGTLSSSPAIPEDDVETVGLQWLLVTHSRMPNTTIGELARLIYENKADLAVENGFASRIEPAATDKEAFIIAHPGAAEYINDDIKSFVERYSDLMYFAAAALGIIGSICATLYTKVTRVAPEKASELATQLLDIGEDCQDATCADDLDRMQDELERILRGVVIGLRDGTISSDGLETFKLGYQFVRDEIAMRREALLRHAHDAAPAPAPAHEDNVVVVKTAQSA